MAEQREDVTPEECKQRYDEYKADYTQRLTHSFIDVHRTEVRRNRGRGYPPAFTSTGVRSLQPRAVLSSCV